MADTTNGTYCMTDTIVTNCII